MTDEDTPNIISTVTGDESLIHHPADATVVASRHDEIGAPDEHVPLDKLRDNFDSICRMGGTYYPVAYRFVRELGRGRQGRVFLAQRHGARGCVTEHAVKLFDPTIYRSTEQYWTDMGRIASQVSQLQRLHSATIVTRDSYEETFGIGHVHMEAVDGIDLRQMLGGEHLKTARSRSTDKEWDHFMSTIFRVDDGSVCVRPGVIVYVLRRALRGLERLHSMGFVHSDVKPANIMINRLGDVKLIDFGRAVLAGEKLSILFGSPLYMAPEAHRRETTDTRSDFYSLGIVVLEMLSGRRLTEKPTVSEEELLEIKADLPGRLAEFMPPRVVDNHAFVASLARLVEFDPDKRYTSAKEADVGRQGFGRIQKQLVQADLDSEYGRDLSDYLSKLVDPATGRIMLADDG